MGATKIVKKSKESSDITHENKLEIFLDNICLKLGVKDKK